MNRIKKSAAVITVTIFASLFANAMYAQSNGEALFKENKAKEAAEVLEYEILNGQVSANTYNFLGLAYYQTEEYTKSLDAFERGIKAQPALFKLLTYNQGNTYYAMKDYTSAVRCYSEVLKEDEKFYDAKLNRANALLMANQLMNARDEYIDYLLKCPSDPQKERIEQLIAALTDEIKRREEEEARLAELEKARWEQFEDSIPQMSDELPEEKPRDWEKVETAIAESTENDDAGDSKEENCIVNEKINEEWEKIEYADKGLYQKYESKSEKVEEEPLITEWQNLSEEDEDELRLLDERSREEYLAWLEEQEKQKKAALEAARKQKEEEDAQLSYRREEQERLYREKMLEEMQKAENERKQKLLEDVANSLQNSQSTNMSAGLDDMMDYNHEGELD